MIYEIEFFFNSIFLQLFHILDLVFILLINFFKNKKLFSIVFFMAWSNIKKYFQLIFYDIVKHKK